MFNAAKEQLLQLTSKTKPTFHNNRFANDRCWRTFHNIRYAFLGEPREAVYPHWRSRVVAVRRSGLRVRAGSALLFLEDRDRQLIKRSEAVRLGPEANSPRSLDRSIANVDEWPAIERDRCMTTLQNETGQYFSGITKSRLRRRSRMGSAAATHYSAVVTALTSV